MDLWSLAKWSREFQRVVEDVLGMFRVGTDWRDNERVFLPRSGLESLGYSCLSNETLIFISSGSTLPVFFEPRIWSYHSHHHHGQGSRHEYRCKHGALFITIMLIMQCSSTITSIILPSIITGVQMTPMENRPIFEALRPYRHRNPHGNQG
jgi:hypothetical protein